MEFLKGKNLTEREEFLYMPVFHWMYVAKHLIVFFLLLLGFIIAWLALDQIINEIFYAVIFAWFIIFLFKIICHICYYKSVEYGVTNKRLILKRGIFKVVTIEIPIDRIESINCNQGLTGILFNYGNLIVSGVGGRRMVFYMVRKPYTLRRKVIEVIDKNKAITVIHGDIPKPVKPEPKPVDDTYFWGTFVKMP